MTQSQDLLEAEVFQSNKKALVTAMLASGIAACCGTYRGSGDEGQIEAIEFTPALGPDTAEPRVAVEEVRFVQRDAAGQPEWDVQSTLLPLSEAAEAFVDAVISRHVAGYQDNEGGYGEVVVTAESGTYVLQHNDYVVETVSSSYEG